MLLYLSLMMNILKPAYKVFKIRLNVVVPVNIMAVATVFIELNKLNV